MILAYEVLRTAQFCEVEEKLLSQMTAEEYFASLKDMDTHELKSHYVKLFMLIRQYQTLFEVASSISVEIDSGHALSRIIEGTYEIIDVEHVSLFLIDSKKGILKMCVSKDINGIEIPLSSGTKIQ